MDIKIDEWFLPFDEEQESVYREISDSYYIVFRVRAEIFKIGRASCRERV